MMTSCYSVDQASRRCTLMLYSHLLYIMIEHYSCMGGGDIWAGRWLAVGKWQAIESPNAPAAGPKDSWKDGA